MTFCRGDNRVQYDSYSPAPPVHESAVREDVRMTKEFNELPSVPAEEGTSNVFKRPRR